VGGIVLTVALVLRVSLLLSKLHQYYDLEYTFMGRLALDLARGKAILWPPGDIIANYQYGSFAAGTLGTQFMTAALAPFLGTNGWALHGSSLAFELVTLGLWFLLARRLLSPGLALLACLPVVVPPEFVAHWQLLPFGNHSEYIWVPVGVALWIAARPTEERGPGAWVAVAVFLTVGVLLYRLNLAACAGLLVASLALGRSRGLWAGLGAVGLCLITVRFFIGTAGGFEHLLEFWDPTRLRPGAALAWFWEYVPQLRGCPRGWNEVFKVVLLAFAPAAAWTAWRFRDLRPVGAFALGWSAAAILLPMLLGQNFHR
jgi:hypothetical protein